MTLKFEEDIQLDTWKTNAFLLPNTVIILISAKQQQQNQIGHFSSMHLFL